MSLYRWIVATTISTAVTAASAQEPPRAWSETVLGDIRRGEYAFSVLEDRSCSAPNRAQDLRARIDSKGLEVTSRLHGADVAAGGWALRLSGPTDLGEAAPEPRGALVERRWLGLTERWLNDEKGLELELTLEAPIHGARESALVLELALEGDLLAYPTEDRRAVVFETARGEAVLRFAVGANVSAGLTVEPGRLRIVLEDEHAIYPLTIRALMSSPTWAATGVPGELLGMTVATAGDVNGDGFSDVVVGAPYFENAFSSAGRALVYLGSASGPSATPDWIVEGDHPFQGIGFLVSPAGDVNRDGYDDLMVGSGEGDLFRALVWYGSADGLGENTTASSADWYMEGDHRGRVQVAYAGDVNGDLFDDIVIGISGFFDDANGEGGAFVFLGSASGLGANGTTSNADWRVEGEQVGLGMGYAVGSAGDVNRDGYDDLIVTAPGFDNGQTREGAAFIFFGSATGLGLTGTPANADWHVEGNQQDASLGASAGTAGDVNGDGYADVLVGKVGGEGAVFLYLGSTAGPGLFPAWAADSNQPFSMFGVTVATAGDVNGDGYADVMIGADAYFDPENQEGAVFLWHGGPSGLGANGTPVNADWSAQGNLPSAKLGAAIGPAGDVNGDGLGDVILGAWGYDVTPNGNEGRAWVYVGSTRGLSAQVSWSLLGHQVDGRLGQAVAGAGDVNGDGYSDVIVTNLLYDNGQTDEGAVFLFPGTASGLSTAPIWSAEGNQAGARLGSSVASAGDVNGDGYGDVIVAASGYTVGGVNVGASFVWHGSAAGMGPTGTPANADWSAVGSSSTFRGKSVASAGDVNGDGYSDVIVGETFSPAIGLPYGQASLYRGGPSGLEPFSPQTVAPADLPGATSFGTAVASAGDVNRDGFSDVIIGAPALSLGESGEGAALVLLGSGGSLLTFVWQAQADQAGAGLGISVASAGDVNGDGCSDVLVGASGYDDGQTDEGAAFIWYGSPTGLGVDGTPANADWSVEGDQNGALFGRSVSGAADVNADGYSDVLVGARAYDNGQTDEGAAFAYHGSASGLGTAPSWTGELNQSGAELGHAVASAGDVNGDGYGDVVIGAPSYDGPGVDNGRAVVHLGNEGRGRNRIPRQARADGAAPIDILGRSESETSFRMRAKGRTPAGRKNLVLDYEIKSLGYAFNGTGLASSANIVPICSTDGCSVDFDELPPYGLAPGTPYRWRVRTSTFSPLFPRTPWIFLPYNASTETDLRTAGCRDGDGDGFGSPPDAACAGAGLDCDDGDPTTHPGALEICDARDNDCDLIVDDNILAPAGSPTVAGLKLGAGTYLKWNARPDATASDVVRGSLIALRSSGGDFATAACLANDQPTNQLESTDLPLVGDGSWYLVRSVNCAGVGTYDDGASSQVSPRDAEINASGDTCP